MKSPERLAGGNQILPNLKLLLREYTVNSASIQRKRHTALCFQ